MLIDRIQKSSSLYTLYHVLHVSAHHRRRLVTSTGSGLSVPDWPNTYGHFMFAYPLDQMVGGIFFEHSHRMIASVVGFLISSWRSGRKT